MKRVPLTEIVVDAGTQVRAATDDSVVSQYAERMTEGDQFPPIVLFHDGTSYYLADGFHRLLAAQRNQWRDIDADVRAGTKQDALWFALGANKANGRQMTGADKRHAILLAFATWPDRSAAVLASQIGCTAQYVRDVRHQVQTSLQLPDRTIGRDGKSHPFTKPGGQQTKRNEVAEMIKAGKSSGEIVSELGVRPELVGKVRREVGVGVDKSGDAVAQRRQGLREMAEQGYSSRQIASTLGLAVETVSRTAKKEGIVISADAIVGKTLRHDANRILERIAMDAENLTVGSDLIDYADIDHERLGGWLDSLHAASKSLRAFIRKLEEEQKKHGEAA